MAKTTQNNLGDKSYLLTLVRQKWIQAQNLYRSFGFYEIPSYRFNPIKGTVYMEKNLEKSDFSYNIHY